MSPYANGHHLAMAAAGGVHHGPLGQLTNGGTAFVHGVPAGLGAATHLGATTGGHHVGHHGATRGGGMVMGAPGTTNDDYGIREVWASNLHEEFRRIREIVRDYPFIAMDTEFPGVVARPLGQFSSNADYQYHLMQVNTQMLKIIQLGLTFMNDEGKTPMPIATWQFNFKFSLSEDMYAQESIDLLTNSGLHFKKHEEEGIDSYEFAVLLIGSGVVLTDNVRWLSFHSGYDFGYLLRLLTDAPLPKKKAEFFELLKLYFPNLYDLKYLMKSTKDLKGGLQEVADMLGVDRKGPQHQAGSDSLLTGDLFFKMREVYFENNLESKHCGVIYGLEFDLPSIHAKSGVNTTAGNNTNNSNSNGGCEESGNGNGISGTTTATSTTTTTSAGGDSYGHVMMPNVRNVNTSDSNDSNDLKETGT